MKEKIKNLILSVCTWKFCMWMNIVFAAYHLVSFCIGTHAANFAGVLFHFPYAMISYFLNEYEVRHRSDVFVGVSLGYRYADCLDKLERYKKIYGDLPSDTSMHLHSTSETKEDVQDENSVAEPSLSMEADEKDVENKSIMEEESKQESTMLNSQVSVKVQRKKRVQKPNKTVDVKSRNSSALSEKPKQKKKNPKEGSMAVKSSDGVKRRIPRTNVSSVVDKKKKEAAR